MAICKKWHHIIFTRTHGGRWNFSEIAMMKKPNYLTFGRAMSGLNVDEPKLSSMLTLRVELKERKCEIRWFKLCSSKLTVTSLTWSDLSFISKGTLSSSSPRTFGFQNGTVGDWTDALWHARKPKPSSDRELYLATSTDYANIFSSYHWCWNRKKYCEAINIAIVRTTRVLQ